MRTEVLEIYSFEELSNEAKQVAIQEVRETYYEDNDFAHWAVDDCALFEPKHEELEELFGKDYDFPLIENTRESIYFNTDRNSFLDCAKAMQVTNDKQFLLWLGIDINEEEFKDISFNIFTPNYRNSDTTIEFEDFDSSFGDVVDMAVEKFNNHIQDVLKRIEADIDYRFTDEAIIEDIEANEWEFYKNGKKY